MDFIDRIKERTTVSSRETTPTHTVIGYFQTVPTEVGYNLRPDGTLTYSVLRGPGARNSLEAEAFARAAREAMEAASLKKH